LILGGSASVHNIYYTSRIQVQLVNIHGVFSLWSIALW
jgi:hypothetical protein